MHDFKLLAKKGAIILFYALLIFATAFVVYTSVNAFKINKNATLDKYVGKQFISRNLESVLTFETDKKISISKDKQTVTYTIKATEKDIVIFVNETDKKEYAIKLVDNNKIYCEIGMHYMYNMENTNEKTDKTT